MKKIFIAFLAVLYLGTSSGATVHFHYCMGKLVDWGVWNNKHTGTAKCDNCGMIRGQKDAKKCCKDETRQVKLTDNHKVAKLAYEFLKFPAAIVPLGCLEFTTTTCYQVTEALPFGHAPPRTGSATIYIYNSTFLI